MIGRIGRIDLADRSVGLIGLLAALLPLAGSAAQPADTPPVELAPLPVEAAAILPETLHTPASGTMAVLAAEEWQRIGAADLAGALRRVPGVTISRYNVVGSFGGGDGGAVFIRGHGAGRPGADISIRYDGVPRLVGVWSHPLLDTIAIDAAAAIEVYKNPQPVLFGNMAFGAVNIEPKRQVTGAPALRLRAAYGSWNTSQATVEAGHSDANSDILLIAGRRASDGHRANAGGETRALFLNAGHRLTPYWEIRYTGQYSKSFAEDPEPVGVVLPLVETYRTGNTFHLLKLSGRAGAHALSIKGYLENGKADWRQWHQPPPPPFPAQQLETRTGSDNSGIHLNLAAADGSPFSWQAGVDFDRAGGMVVEDFAAAPDNLFGRKTFSTLAPYALLEYRHRLDQRSSLTLSGGLRHFIHDTFANETGAQLGAALEREPLTLTARWARSVNYPGVFVSVFGRRPPPWSVGNDWRQLAAEQVDSFEAGLAWRAGRSVRIHASAFHAAVSDALLLVAPPPVGYIRNLGGYNLQGAELAVRAELTASLHFAAGATWIEAGRDIPNTPRWNLQAGLVWQPHADLEISAGWQYLGERRVLNPRFGDNPVDIAGFNLLDAAVRYRLPPAWGTRATLFAQAENLTDRSYAYRPGYPMPGFNIHTGIEIIW